MQITEVLLQLALRGLCRERLHKGVAPSKLFCCSDGSAAPVVLSARAIDAKSRLHHGSRRGEIRTVAMAIDHATVRFVLAHR